MPSGPSVPPSVWPRAPGNLDGSSPQRDAVSRDGSSPRGDAVVWDYDGTLVDYSVKNWGVSRAIIE
jgi:hypothetical protein